MNSFAQTVLLPLEFPFVFLALCVFLGLVCLAAAGVRLAWAWIDRKLREMLL